MNLSQRIEAFVQSGLFIRRHFNIAERLENEAGLHQGLDHLIEMAQTYNGWFIKDFVKESFLNIAQLLDRQGLQDFAKNIPEPKVQKTVAIIMAGNIPMVGFHDLLCVVLSGHKALIKLSSDDNVLMPFFVKLLDHYQPGMSQFTSYAEDRLANFDAVIATGSGNTSKYFEFYFGKYPNIIRKNRVSVAILKGDESEDDLKRLGKDIFTYFGLGCRNVSKLLVPKGYKFDKVFEAVFDYKFVIDNKKYGNNYDYNRAIYLLNLEPFLDNNFMIIKDDKGLFSPVSVVFSQEFESEKDLNDYLETNKDLLQCVVGNGKNLIPFGYSQQPVITEFADKVNTLDFLVNL
jgi:hypothetical protein